MIWGAFWIHFGSILGSWGAPGGLGGSQEAPKSVQERQHVDFEIILYFQRVPQERLERSESVQNRSGTVRERPRRQQGSKHDQFWDDLGVHFGVIWG